VYDTAVVNRILITAMAVLVAAGTAQAERIGVVVRTPVGAPVDRSTLEEAIVAAASAVGDQVIVDPFAQGRRQLANGAVRKEQLSRYGRAEELLSEGVRAYQAGDVAFAAARLAEARRLAADSLALVGGVELYATISFHLGAAKLDLGRMQAAADDFRLAYSLDSKRRVTTAEFKPSVVQQYTAVVAAQRGTVRAVIGANVAGARVEIDGKSVGLTPARVTVEKGLHAVVVREAGHVPYGALIDLRTEGARVDVQLQVDEERRAVLEGGDGLSIGGDSKARIRLVAGAITWADLDALVMVSATWRRGALVILAEWCKEVDRCGRVVEVGFPKASGVKSAAGVLWRQARESRGQFSPGLFADARVTNPEGSPGSPLPPPPHSRPLYRNPWLWLGVGSVAVTVTAVLLLRGDKDLQPEFEIGSDLYQGSILRW
jgi:hypothetical protein